MDGTLDHVMTRVGDLDDSLEWYRSRLDYEEKDRWEADDYRNPASRDDMYAFTTDQDGHEIELIERESLDPPLFPE